MEYRVISGRVVEIRRTRMKVRSVGDGIQKRAPRKAGNTSEKKIKANEQESVKQLARVLNCNMMARDAHIVLLYDDEHIPESYEWAEAHLKKFMSKVRYEFKKLYGRNPKMAWVTSNWSPQRNAPTYRYHHHLVIEEAGIDVIRSLWTAGNARINTLDNRGDHSELAAYMIANVHDIREKKKWSCSRNMERPVYTEPIPVDDPQGIESVKDSIVRAVHYPPDEEGNIISGYMRCVLKERPKVRGGKIIMPSGKRRNKRE